MFHRISRDAPSNMLPAIYHSWVLDDVRLREPPAGLGASFFSGD
ncbi:MAG: hypothetical protein Q8P67_06250 [archaeon]|nr:hypothetical protein [archaeon]